MGGERFEYLPFDLVNRKHWGAREPADDDIQLVPPVPFVIHTYTDTEPCYEKGQCIQRMKNIQARDLQSGLSDIKYNFVIGGDSSVYVGRGWTNLPDMNADFPNLYERSIEIAHIGYEGEPTEDIMHVVKLFLRYGVAKNHLKSNFKYVKIFKEIAKDEEHYEFKEAGELEMTCYKKLGVDMEKDESDEYKVLADPTLAHEYDLIDEDDDELGAIFKKEESVDAIDGVKIDSSLLDFKDKGALDGSFDPSLLDN